MVGVDHEIDVINKGIASVYDVLFKINANLDETLGKLNGSLTQVDEGINQAIYQVNQISGQVVHIAGLFPLTVSYYLILFLIITLLLGLAAFLVFHIYRQIVEREYYKDQFIRKFGKKVYNKVPSDVLLEESETPPPTYDEYVQTADLYVKYHRQGPSTSDHRELV